MSRLAHLQPIFEQMFEPVSAAAIPSDRSAQSPCGVVDPEGPEPAEEARTGLLIANAIAAACYGARGEWRG